MSVLTRHLPMRINQEMFFQVGCTFLFALVLIRNIYLSLFLMWTLFLYAYFGFPGSMADYLVNTMFGCVVFEVAYQVVNGENITKFYKALLWFAFANIIYLILQSLNFDFIFYQNNLPCRDLVAFMGLKAFMGMFFALLIPIAAYFNPWVAATFFVPIYLSDASCAIAGGVASFLWVIYFKSKKAFLILLCLLLIGTGFYIKRDYRNGMFEDRANLWKVVMKDAFYHPILGYGLDGFRSMNVFKDFMYVKNYRNNESYRMSINEYENYRSTGLLPNDGRFKEGDAVDIWDNAHNEYVQLFYEFGIFGVILLIAMMIEAKQRFFINKHTITIMGFFISLLVVSTGHFPLHVARLGYLFPVFLAIYWKITDCQKLNMEF